MPVKNVFLFLLVSCLLLLFLPYFIDLMCFLPKLIPQVIDQSFKKIFLINVETGNTLYSEYLVSLSTYNMCKAVEGQFECDLQDALIHHGSELLI